MTAPAKALRGSELEVVEESDKANGARMEGVARAECSGLNDNGPHRIIDFNIWFPVGASV